MSFAGLFKSFLEWGGGIYNSINRETVFSVFPRCLMQTSILPFITFYYNCLFMCLTPLLGCDCHLASLQQESCAWRGTPGWAVAWIPFFRPWADHCHPISCTYTDIPPLHMLRSGVSISGCLSCPGGYPVYANERCGQTQLVKIQSRRESRTSMNPQLEDGGLRRWKGKWGCRLFPPLPLGGTSLLLPTIPGDGMERSCLTNKFPGSQAVGSELLRSHPETQLRLFSNLTLLPQTPSLCGRCNCGSEKENDSFKGTQWIQGRPVVYLGEGLVGALFFSSIRQKLSRLGAF